MKELPAVIELLCSHAKMAFLVVENERIKFSNKYAELYFPYRVPGLEGIEITELIPDFGEILEKLTCEQSSSQTKYAKYTCELSQQTRVDGRNRFFISVLEFDGGKENQIMIALTKKSDFTNGNMDLRDSIITSQMGMLHDMSCFFTTIRGYADLMDAHDELDEKSIRPLLKTLIEAVKNGRRVLDDMFKNHRSNREKLQA